MPPDVRSSYEIEQTFAEAQRALDKVQSAGGTVPIAGMEKFAPAWGGPRPEGSVPVPAVYAGVSGLGPVLKVYEHQGFDLDLLHLGTPHIESAVRYRDGLAYQAVGKEVHAWRWEEVAAILSDFVQHVGTHSGEGYPVYEYLLVKQNGDKLLLDSDVKDVNDLGAAIKQAAYALIGPPLGQRYKLGEAVTFGPVTVQQPNGIQMEGKPFAWAAIQDVKIENGRLAVTLRDGKKHSVRAKAIPNVEILCQLLGIKCDDFDLTYWPGL